MTKTVPDDADGIVLEVTDGVLRVTLDRVHRRNALDPTAVRRIVDALESASMDDSLRVVVIAGRGPDFCSGADWVASNDRGGERPRVGNLQRRTALQAHRLIELIVGVQLPVVCAVQGWAAGLGCQLALAADFTIATETSRFWEPFTQRGFTPDSGATWLLPRLVGVARAKELLLLGREVTGAEAAEWGLLHRAVPEGSLEDETASLVDRLATSATVAIGLSKQCINRALDCGLSEAMQHEAFALELSSRSTDFKEGLVAFKQRRPPTYTGR
jgi:2-(1,2-epoxy-1,2-dihydrophenyl)acetyl-CoA isomerase